MYKGDFVKGGKVYFWTKHSEHPIYISVLLHYLGLKGVYLKGFRVNWAKIYSHPLGH